MNVSSKGFPAKLITMGDGSTLLLPNPDGGTLIVSGVHVNAWSVSVAAPMADVTMFGDDTPKYMHTLREVDGTIGFRATGLEFSQVPLDNGPIVKEYSIRDLLQIVREKIQDR